MDSQQVRHLGKRQRRWHHGSNRANKHGWLPSGCSGKFAAVTTDKVVYLFDEGGERKDKFKTKPGDAAAGANTYVIRAMAFSPDSSKLAVAQSDNIVYIYRSA